jgi:hypothetical protein
VIVRNRSWPAVSHYKPSNSKGPTSRITITETARGTGPSATSTHNLKLNYFTIHVYGTISLRNRRKKRMKTDDKTRNRRTVEHPAVSAPTCKDAQRSAQKQLTKSTPMVLMYASWKVSSYRTRKSPKTTTRCHKPNRPPSSWQEFRQPYRESQQQ